MIKIRSSILPEYHDCARRSAAVILRTELHGMGYELRQRSRVISGCVGHALHAIQKTALISKANGIDPEKKTCFNYGVSEFGIEIADGVDWDDVTQNTNAALKQLQRMSAAFFEDVLPSLDPAVDAVGPIIERYRSATLSDTFETGGSMDYELINDDIGDTKTGKSGDGYEAQLGCYSLLKKANTGTGARKLFIEHVPRVPISKPYPGAERIVYNTELCETVAYMTLKAIMRDIRNFQETQSPWCFPCNRSSMLCSQKFCTAHGTSFCELTRGN
jgi:hypothetical protein